MKCVPGLDELLFAIAYTTNICGNNARNEKQKCDFLLMLLKISLDVKIEFVHIMRCFNDRNG